MSTSVNKLGDADGDTLMVQSSSGALENAFDLLMRGSRERRHLPVNLYTRSTE